MIKCLDILNYIHVQIPTGSVNIHHLSPGGEQAQLFIVNTELLFVVSSELSKPLFKINPRPVFKCGFVFRAFQRMCKMKHGCWGCYEMITCKNSSKEYGYLCHVKKMREIFICLFCFLYGTEDDHIG